MNILIMESDWADRQHLKWILKKVAPEDEVCSFHTSAEALEFAKEHAIDVAFIDLGGAHKPGLFLANHILELQKTNIVFTNYEWEYLREAFQLRVSGYLRKPLQYDELMTELQDLRYPLSKDRPNQTDEPVFRNTKPNVMEKLVDKFWRIIASLF